MNNAVEYILCAANKYTEKLGGEKFIVDDSWIRSGGISPYNITEGVVLCGWRHACILAQFYALTKLMPGQYKCEQGFLTNKNRFVDRKEAAEIAFGAGQINKIVTKLYSEDLY